MNFFRTPFFLPLLYPQLTWRIKTAAKELYLTFDDGPVPGPTEFVIETLKRSGIPATFFCIGDNVSKHPGLLRKVKEEGHTIGNHTFHHVSGWRTSRLAYKMNTELCSQTIQETIGLETPFFRPPYGRITRSQVKLLKDYKIIMWDVLTHDYATGLSPESCLRGSLSAIRPGSIIVLHDSLKAERNLTYVLPRLIDHVGGLGYSFKSLS